MTLEELQPIHILLVEDNPGDVRLTQETLKEAKVRNTLSIARDGMEALDYLYQRGPYTQAPRPDLILLDLNLPKKGGLEILEEIKAHKTLRRIPVVILTTSKDDQDILKSYDHYANAYIVKPVDLDQFMTVVSTIEDFWLEIVRLVPRKR